MIKPTCLGCVMYSANLKMLEPASMAVGCYIASKVPHILRRKPCLRRSGVWLKHNREELSDVCTDELTQLAVDHINDIHYHVTPTQLLFICLFYALLIGLSFF